MKKIDYTLLTIVLFLLGFGILMLSGISAVYSISRTASTTYFLNRQLIAIAIGLMGGFFLYKCPFSFLKKFALPAFVFSLFLNYLPIIPGLGIKTGGATRWVNLFFINFQPSELLKITLIFYLSVWLTNKKEKTFLPFLTILGVIFLALYWQKDLSTFFIIVFIGLVIYFLAEKSLYKNIGIWLTALFGFSLFFLESYRLNRIFTFLDMNKGTMDFQIRESLITVGSGGFWGKGLGFSSQKLLLPHGMSDSIFAIIAEEVGFIISFLVLFFFFFFFYKTICFAKENKNKSVQLIIIAISIWFLSQSLVHVAALVGYLPLTGIPLPLISYGGSHIVAELLAVGLMFSALKKSKK